MSKNIANSVEDKYVNITKYVTDGVKKVELLAPAGNTEGFYGAIHAGADAVYLGGQQFGARAYAENFTEEELIACIRYAHIRGRKVYLTVNTLVKESEMDEILPYLTPYYEAGLDGVIVQDIGVFCLIRDHFPGLELHVSTQMTLTGKYGANLLKQMGACRVVPARELSLEEIKELKSETGLEVECFIHGAMCYCYSGQCLFSSILGGRSGNRGKCAQPCRLPYQVEIDGKNFGECYPLSLKDMCTIEHIPELIRAGIDSFKIEGRMKKPEYAAGVTAIYRKYIDQFYAGEDCQVSAQDLKRLSELYIRSERQDGYYYRHSGADMVTLKSPSYANTNDELIAEIRRKYIEQKDRISVKMKAELRIGKPARLTWSLRKPELQISVIGEQVVPAQKQPVTEENIRKQLSKLGDTVFAVEEIDVSMDQDCFYPLKALNDLRRSAVREMEDSLIRQQGLCVSRSRKECSAQTQNKTNRSHESRLHVLVTTKEQLEAVHELAVQKRPDSSALDSVALTVYPIERIYIESDLIYQICREESRNNKADKNFDNLEQYPCDLIIALPQILRKRDVDFWDAVMQFALHCEGVKGFLVRSMDGLGALQVYLPKSQKHFAIYTDAGFYTWNLRSLQAFEIDGFCIPYELKATDQRKLLSSGIPCEKIVYGYIPLMHTANCVFRTLSGCKRENSGKTENAGKTEITEKPAYLIDRYRKRFPVLKNCGHCMNIIYNCLPLSLHGELSKWQGDVDFRVDLTLEKKAQTMEILRYFMTGCHTDRPYEEFTNGHEKRGAE